jgi:hypothetical protein
MSLTVFPFHAICGKIIRRLKTHCISKSTAKNSKTGLSDNLRSKNGDYDQNSVESFDKWWIYSNKKQILAAK